MSIISISKNLRGTAAELDSTLALKHHSSLEFTKKINLGKHAQMYLFFNFISAIFKEHFLKI